MSLNKLTFKELTKLISKKHLEKIQIDMIENKKTPVYILEELSQDNNFCNDILKSPKLNDTMFKNIIDNMIISVESNHYFDTLYIDFKEYLINSQSYISELNNININSQLAKVTTDLEIFKKLLNKENKEVYYSCFANPLIFEIDENLFENTLKENNYEIKDLINFCQNNLTPDKLFMNLFKDIKLKFKELKESNNDWNSRFYYETVLQYIAKNSNDYNKNKILFILNELSEEPTLSDNFGFNFESNIICNLKDNDLILELMNNSYDYFGGFDENKINLKLFKFFEMLVKRENINVEILKKVILLFKHGSYGFKSAFNDNKFINKEILKDLKKSLKDMDKTIDTDFYDKMIKEILDKR